jgi:hypothetical protein
MRELTKSTLSAGLAMSLFGMQTMMNAFRRPQAGGPSRAVEDLDAVTKAVVERTGNMLRETFQMGDKVQRGLVDMTFGFLTLAPLRSGGGMSMMGDTTRRAADQMRRWMGGMGMGGMGMGGMGDGSGSDCGCSGGAPPTRPSPWSTTPPSPSGSAVPLAESWGPMSDPS